MLNKFLSPEITKFSIFLVSSKSWSFVDFSRAFLPTCSSVKTSFKLQLLKPFEIKILENSQETISTNFPELM